MRMLAIRAGIDDNLRVVDWGLHGTFSSFAG
jgi:hypothetical protein